MCSKVARFHKMESKDFQISPALIDLRPTVAYSAPAMRNHKHAPCAAGTALENACIKFHKQF